MNYNSTVTTNTAIGKIVCQIRVYYLLGTPGESLAARHTFFMRYQATHMAFIATFKPDFLVAHITKCGDQKLFGSKVMLSFLQYSAIEKLITAVQNKNILLLLLLLLLIINSNCLYNKYPSAVNSKNKELRLSVCQATSCLFTGKCAWLRLQQWMKSIPT